MDNTKDAELNIDKEKLQKEAEEAARETVKRQAIESTKQKIVIVDTEEMVEAEARKAADAYMTEDKAKSGILRKFWRHSFMEAYYRGREIDRVREEIKNSGNIYAGRITNDNKTAHNNTMQAISNRFISDYEGTIKEGEKKEVLNDKDPKTVQARNDIKNLISEYAKKNIEDEAFEEAKNRIFNSLNNKNSRNALSNYADNLLEIARNARIAIEHGAKMDEMDLDTSIILGKAKSSLKTEAHYNAVDKAVAWTKESKIGRFFSPSLVSTSIGIGYSLSIGLGAKFLRSKAAAYGTFGAAVAVSSALSGMNESQRLAAERAQHGLEMAEGGQIGPDSKRRDQMQQFQYQMESSKVLAERLRSLMYEKDKDGNDVPKDIKQSDLDQIFASLAEIDARNSLNQKNRIDLISYTNIGSVEKESTDLTILTARAKKDLGEKLKGSLKNGIPQGQNFESFLAERTQTIENCLLGGDKGIDANDKEFSKYKTKESFKKALKTALVGLTVGATVQEFVAFFKDDVQGVFEGIFHHDSHAITQTPLEHIYNWITGHPSHMGLGNAVEIPLDGNHFKLPEGTNIIQNSDCTYNIVRGDQIISNHIPLTFDEAGNIDDASIARLGEDGIVANTTCQTIDGTKTIAIPAKDWVHNNIEKTTHIFRSWMGNDTPMYADPNHAGHLLGADLNELRTQWAGINGTGIDEHGDYVMTIQHMTNDGSFQDGVSVAARDEMLKGKLEVLLSVTKDTQTHVIKGIIGADGLVHFDHKDANIQMLFENVKGHAQYDGAFIEIAKHNGNMPDGREMMQILGTHIGTDHVKDIIETIPTHVEIPITNLDLPLGTEPPYFLPIWARTPLEPITYKEGEKPLPPSKEEITPVVPPKYGYNEKRKQNYSNLKSYRNTDKQIEELIKNISTNPNFIIKGKDGKETNKYEFITKRLETLKNFNYLSPKEKAQIEKERLIYNYRYFGKEVSDKYLTMDKFVEKEIKRLYSQAENIYIENNKVGDKPYDKSFYENAALVKGLENCKEVVLVLDDPMGDGILTLPIINSINKYFELNGSNKKIKVISKNYSKLYKSLEEQFPRVEVLSIPESEKYFEKNNKDLFVFNTNGNFENYKMFNISEEESKDLSRVFSVDWASWTKEESPIDEHNFTKYDPLPSRIARNIEIMVGQKLFENIKDTEKYIEKSKKFDSESKNIKKKYSIKDKEELIVISVGSSASAKEYSPEKWKEVIDGIYKMNPDSHILVLNEPDKTKRAKYGDAFDELAKQKGYKISHADEGLESMNTIMSMADVIVTPDTGLGHYVGALGKKAVMMYLSDPVLWSTPGVKRVIHPKGYETYKRGIGLDSKLWGGSHYNNDEFYADDGGIGVGASDIEPGKILYKINESKYQTIEMEGLWNKLIEAEKNATITGDRKEVLEIESNIKNLERKMALKLSDQEYLKYELIELNSSLKEATKSGDVDLIKKIESEIKDINKKII